MEARITKKQLKNKVRYDFTLHADGVEQEEIARSSDRKKGTYTQKHNCIETLQKYFPLFTIIDNTNE